MAGFDLNPARVFVLLYENGGGTATAETLHVTQPTVSYSLRKPPPHLGGELFPRTRRGVGATPLARRGDEPPHPGRRRDGGVGPPAGAGGMWEPLHGARAEIAGALRRGGEFAPATTAARFTLALSDLGEVTLLPRLAAAARDRAPQVSFSVRPLDVD